MWRKKPVPIREFSCMRLRSGISFSRDHMGSPISRIELSTIVFTQGMDVLLFSWIVVCVHDKYSVHCVHASWKSAKDQIFAARPPPNSPREGPWPEVRRRLGSGTKVSGYGRRQHRTQEWSPWA